MVEPTKEKLTRQSLCQELIKTNRAALRHAVYLSVFCSLFLIPLVTLILRWTIKETNGSVWVWLFATLPALLYLLPVVLAIWFLWDGLQNRRLLSQDAFEVITAELSYKSEEYVHRQYRELLHFAGFDRPLQVGHTAYQLATEGDLYYLVHYRGKKTVVLFYACKMYEYTDRVD